MAPGMQARATSSMSSMSNSMSTGSTKRQINTGNRNTKSLDMSISNKSRHATSRNTKSHPGSTRSLDMIKSTSTSRMKRQSNTKKSAPCLQIWKKVRGFK